MMNKIKWTSIIEDIKNDENINFIAEAITPLHLLGIKAYIEYLKGKGVICKGYILVVSHDITGLAIRDELTIKHISRDIQVVLADFDSTISTIDTFSFFFNYRVAKKCDKFYYVTPFKPSFERLCEVAKVRKNSRVMSVITDEGMASYLRNPYRTSKSLVKNWRMRDWIRFIVRSYCLEQSFERKLKKNGSYEDFLLLKKGKKWEENPIVATAYRDVLSENVINEDYSVYEGSYLICPSLLFESGIIKDRSDIEIYRKIRVFSSDKNSWVVKPHPREKNIKDYDGIGIIENRYDIPQETILANLKNMPRVILGDSSSALIYGKVIFGIPAISINRLINKKTLVDRKYFEPFNKTFESVIDIPHNETELREAICKIK